MIRRVLLGLAFTGAAFAGLDCELFFPPSGSPAASLFAGCFTGPITEPAGPGRLLTIVLQKAPGATDGLSLTGCVTATEPRVAAALAGMVLEDRTQARVIAMQQGRPPFVLLVRRRPASGNATTVGITNESGMPFVSAPDLPRCSPEMSCDDLGITQAFMPGGAP